MSPRPYIPPKPIIHICELCGKRMEFVDTMIQCKPRSALPKPWMKCCQKCFDRLLEMPFREVR